MAAKPKAKSRAKKRAAGQAVKPRAPAPKSRKTWSRRAQERPDEVLEAALDEFIAKGFDAARMEDIAKRAGLSKAAVYLYFDSKEAILRALIEKKVNSVLDPVRAMAAATTDPRATLRQMISTIGAALGDARLAAIPFLVISIANRFPDLADFYRRNVIARGRSVGEALIKRGIELGQFRVVDVSAASRAMIGPLIFEVLWAHAFKGPSEVGKSTRWLETQMDILLKGIERPAKPAAKRKAEKPR